MNSLPLPDVVAKAAGRILADLHAEWRKDIERIGAESRATIAELRAEVLSLKAALKANADEQAARVGEALAKVKDGEPGKDGEQGIPGERGEPGEPGKDADPEVIKEMVSEAVAALPPPQEAKEADPEALARLIAQEVEKAVSGLPAPKDGRDGRDGLPGIPGEKGMDGRNGVDGKDGLGVDNFDVTYDGERTFTLKWSAPDRVEERVFVMPLVLDRGVYSAGKAYEQGDGVTFGGSYWIAQEPTADKPEMSKAWRLSAKRGRDGKDGVVKHEGPPKPVKV